MKRLSVTRFVAVSVLACAAAQAEAADMANPTGFMYYGYGQGSFGYSGAGYAPGMASYGAGAMPASYGYGYASGPANPGYGYAGYGYGGAGYVGYGHAGPHARRGHCCSFGGNCNCCNNAWDGYAGCADGACCGGPVKVHRRHRALGAGAGPCVDASCGAAPPRRHLCHLRRRHAANGAACYGNVGTAAPGMIYDNGTAQPTTAAPDAEEQVQPPSPALNYGDGP